MEAQPGPNGGRSPETVDRLMVGACGAVWLVLLAASVFATVAMVRLGSGRTNGPDGQSSWLLYSIIGVSAVVIIGAVPLLIRARQAAAAAVGPDESPADPGAPAPSAPKARVFGVDPDARHSAEVRQVGVSEALVDRLWLRGTVSVLGAMGLALTAVAIGGYLLADRNDTGAWVVLGLAGVITVAMPAVMIYFERQIGAVVSRVGSE